MCELAFNPARERHGMCESGFIVPLSADAATVRSRDADFISDQGAVFGDMINGTPVPVSP
jgi:hypothetical protein